MAQTSVDEVFRDFNTPGNPASGDYKPEKPRIRALLKQIMNQGGQAVTRNTYAALSGVTPPTENYMGIVLNYGAERDTIKVLSPDRTEGLEFWITNKIREVRDRGDGVKHKIGLLTGHDEIKLSEPNLVPSNSGQKPHAA